MGKILSIETATGVCSVAIADDGNVIGIAEELISNSHAAKITVLIQECLDKTNLKIADLDAIAVSTGPGSYTGLRIGASAAKGICYASGKPLIAVDTLKSLASESRAQYDGEQALYCPMIDARRMEVYTSVFDESGKALEEVQALIVTPEAFEKYRADYKIVLSGNGAEKCKAILGDEDFIYQDIRNSAAHLVSLAEVKFQTKDFEDVAYFEPFYFKKPNITKSKKQYF